MQSKWTLAGSVVLVFCLAIYAWLYRLYRFAVHTRERTGRLISLDAIARARRSVFMLSLSCNEKPVGVGVFCAAGMAVTAAHNLGSGRTMYVFGCYGPRDTSGAPAEGFRLRVVSRDDELDVAVLECDRSYMHPHFLELFQGALADLVGESMVLCTFQLPLRGDLHEFHAGLAVMPAVCVKRSSAERHIVFACSFWSGDSGGALLMYDDQLVGIHLALVNALHETLERKLAAHERLNSVEASLIELIHGSRTGGVALLASQFPLRPCGGGGCTIG